jgi:hypothetical protein
MQEVLVNIGAGEGTRTLVFSMEVDELCNAFNGHSDFFATLRMVETTTEFLVVGMAIGSIRRAANYLR